MANSELTQDLKELKEFTNQAIGISNAIINHTEFINSKLPNEYQELTYIQSTNDRTQYIDTELIPKSNLKIECKILVVNYSTYDVIIGQTINDMNNGSIALRVFNSPSIDCSYSGHQSIEVNTSYNTELEISAWNCGITVNNSTKSKSAISFTPNNLSLYMFGCNQSNALWRGFYGRIYYMRLYNDNNLVREFIPAKRKSDNVVGMYDLVNNKFYINNGSGSFIAGEEVNEEW